jgi:hypothetical protein
LRQLDQGKTVYIRQNGSWFIKDDSIKITDRKSLSEFRFPTDIHITISKWPNGIHWYLTDNTSNNKFPKFSTVDGALSEALKYTSRSNIEIKYESGYIIFDDS